MAKLFESWQIDSMKVENRIIIAPMCQYSATDGVASDWHLQHWSSFAISGAGIAIIEATAVSAQGRISPRDLGIYSTQCQREIKKILEYCKSIGRVPFAIQLAHAGRKASTQVPWIGRGQISPSSPEGWQTLAPSAIGFEATDHPPKELDLSEIAQIKREFVDSARAAQDCGFHAIELHMAHGYLLHEFLSPLANLRSDKYGGDLGARMRLPLEIYEAVRSAVQIPVWVRISATDYVEGGWDLSQSIEFAKNLQGLGCPLIHVSSGGLTPQQRLKIFSGYQIGFAEEIKKVTSMAVVGVGLITHPLQAEQIIKESKLDAIAIARAFLYDPRWPWHAAVALGGQIRVPNPYLRAAPESVINTSINR